MTNEGAEESDSVLAQQPLRREGLHVKLDRGFEDGTYCVYAEFAPLASRVGSAAARRTAAEYCGFLKAQLERFPGHSVGEMESGSQSRKEDGSAYLTFPVEFADGGGLHDIAMRQQFRSAVFRALQEWDQMRAQAKAGRHDKRRDQFRQDLDVLLHGEAYRHVDASTRDRLLAEVPVLAFPPRGVGR